jgi:hypothetical protein
VGRHSAAEVVPTTRSGRFGHRTRSGFNAFILYVAPVIAFVGSIVAGAFGVAQLQAALGHGTTGYFIAQSYSCTTYRYGQQCGWNGEFELADGKIIGTAFAYDETDPAMRAGTKVAALDPSGSLDTAFPRQWNWGWLVTLLVALIGFAGSVLWFWAAVRGAYLERVGRAPPGPLTDF